MENTIGVSAQQERNRHSLCNVKRCKDTCYGVTMGRYGTSWNVIGKVLVELRRLLAVNHTTGTLPGRRLARRRDGPLPAQE